MPVTNRPATGNQSGSQERWNQPSQHDSSTQGTIQQVKDQAKEVVDSASDLANKAKDKVQEIASNVATQVKDKGQEFAHTAAERAEDLGVELTNMVRRYPVQALLVGFGIGLLMGRVSRI